MFFLRVKGLNAEDIHKEMFPVYGGKCCHMKRFRAGWQTFPWWRTGWDGGAEVAETTVTRLLWCGFRRTGNAMGQVYQCWWRIRREINISFSGANITCFTFYIYLWPIYWLSLAVILQNAFHTKSHKNRWINLFYYLYLKLIKKLAQTEVPPGEGAVLRDAKRPTSVVNQPYSTHTHTRQCKSFHLRFSPSFRESSLFHLIPHSRSFKQRYSYV
jgi:hypothetical protein